jgi:hypothetical protein
MIAFSTSARATSGPSPASPPKSSLQRGQAPLPDLLHPIVDHKSEQVRKRGLSPLLEESGEEADADDFHLRAFADHCVLADLIILLIRSKHVAFAV